MLTWQISLFISSLNVCSLPKFRWAAQSFFHSAVPTMLLLFHQQTNFLLSLCPFPIKNKFSPKTHCLWDGQSHYCSGYILSFVILIPFLQTYTSYSFVYIYILHSLCWPAKKATLIPKSSQCEHYFQELATAVLKCVLSSLSLCRTSTSIARLKTPCRRSLLTSEAAAVKLSLQSLLGSHSAWPPHTAHLSVHPSRSRAAFVCVICSCKCCSACFSSSNPVTLLRVGLVAVRCHRLFLVSWWTCAMPTLTRAPTWWKNYNEEIVFWLGWKYWINWGVINEWLDFFSFLWWKN